MPDSPRRLALMRSAASARDFMPSLDDVARDPSLTQTLSDEQAGCMVISCASALGALRERCREPLLPVASDRALSAAQVAELIGMSKSWVEHHHDELPLRRSIAGTPRWLLSDIETWLKNRARYGHTS